MEGGRVDVPCYLRGCAEVPVQGPTHIARCTSDLSFEISCNQKLDNLSIHNVDTHTHMQEPQ